MAGVDRRRAAGSGVERHGRQGVEGYDAEGSGLARPGRTLQDWQGSPGQGWVWIGRLGMAGRGSARRAMAGKARLDVDGTDMAGMDVTGGNVADDLQARGLFDEVAAIVRSYGVTMNEATGRDRYKQITRARHAAWRHLRGLGFSYPEVARMWGVDHSTVISAVKGRKL